MYFQLHAQQQQEITTGVLAGGEDVACPPAGT